MHVGNILRRYLALDFCFVWAQFILSRKKTKKVLAWMVPRCVVAGGTFNEQPSWVSENRHTNAVVVNAKTTSSCSLWYAPRPQSGDRWRWGRGKATSPWRAASLPKAGKMISDSVAYISKSWPKEPASVIRDHVCPLLWLYLNLASCSLKN